MTNIIKAPILKIRRKGPNGEYSVSWEEIHDALIDRLENEAELEMGLDDWRLIDGFYYFQNHVALTHVGMVQGGAGNSFIAIVCVHRCGELKWFSLARLMPELECW